MASSNGGNTQWYQPVVGLGNVGSYQASGVPWASSSIGVEGTSGTPVEVSFPNVTKFFVVKNLTSNPLRVGFSSAGVVGNNHFVLTNLESFSGDLRVTKIYLLGNTTTATSASIIAGLTGIPANELPNSWSGSTGVG